MREYPSSYLQEQWWRSAIERSTNHNILSAWSVTGEVDGAALDAAVWDLAQRHGALRTGFGERDGHVYQRVAGGIEAVIDHVDLTAEPNADRAWNALVLADGDRAFALDWAPLWRARIGRLAADRYALGLSVSHTIADGWSMAIAGRDLARLYRARVDGVAAQLPALAVDFGDYAGWERTLCAPTEEAWWAERLAPAVGRRKRLADPSRPFEMRIANAPRLDGELVARLRGRVTGGASLAAAATVAAARVAGQPGDTEVIVGVIDANRRLGGVQSVLGPIFTYLPVPVPRSTRSTFMDAVRETHEATAEARRRALPLGLIERVAGPRTPGTLFDVAVDFLPHTASPPRPTGPRHWSWTPLAVRDLVVCNRGVGRFALSIPTCFVVREQDEGGLDTELYFDAATLAPDQANELAAAFHQELVLAAGDEAGAQR